MQVDREQQTADEKCRQVVSVLVNLSFFWKNLKAFEKAFVKKN